MWQWLASFEAGILLREGIFMRFPICLVSMFTVAVLPLVSACGLGDQLGGSNESICVETGRSRISLDHDPGVGYRPRDVLDVALGSFETPFSLSVPLESYAGLRVVPNSEESTLHVEIASTAVDAVHLEIAAQRDDGTLEPGGCLDAIEIEASVYLRSDDGAFDDTFATVLRTETGTTADLTFELEAGALNGSFDVIEEDELLDLFLEGPPSNWVLDHTEMDLSVAPERIVGSLTTWFRGELPEERDFVALVGLWHSDGTLDCYADDFGGALDEGQAMSRLRERLAEPLRFEFTYGEGQGTNFVADATFVSPAEACLAATTLSFDTVLELSDPESGDQIARVPLSGFVAYTDAGEVEWVSLDAFLDQGAELAEDFGMDTKGIIEPLRFYLSLTPLGLSGWQGSVGVVTWSEESPAVCPEGTSRGPYGCHLVMCGISRVQ